ncbi:30561_t:CDS:1, partial [Racocetra persica]
EQEIQHNLSNLFNTLQNEQWVLANSQPNDQLQGPLNNLWDCFTFLQIQQQILANSRLNNQPQYFLNNLHDYICHLRNKQLSFSAARPLDSLNSFWNYFCDLQRQQLMLANSQFNNQPQDFLNNLYDYFDFFNNQLNDQPQYLNATNLKNGKSPRPMNHFMLYRRKQAKEICAKNPNARFTSGELSKRISKMWSEEPREVIAIFNELAKDAKHQHKIKYPGYKYCPKKPNGKKQRNRNT